MAQDLSSPVSFTGNVLHQLDDKNRVTIPSAWRRLSGTDDWLLVPEQKRRCLLVMTPIGFADIITKAKAVDGASPMEVRRFLRLLHAKTQHGAPDKQGRLVLPLDLCQELELTSEVKLVGSEGRFEVWNVARWQQVFVEDESVYEHIGNLVGL